MLHDDQSQNPTPASVVGVGVRGPHFQAFAEGSPDVDWVEVHAETFFCDGGPRLHILERIRAHYPLSLHGVGMSLGSDQLPDPDHLKRLKDLAERFSPFMISEHLAWARHKDQWLNDLLPVPLTSSALDRFVANTDHVQQVLGRQILIENPSTYLRFCDDMMFEWEFLAELTRRAGCGLLLDLNNIAVNAANHGFDPLGWLDGLEKKMIGEYHLAGHRIDHIDGVDVHIDDHASAVDDQVWSLFNNAIQRFGVRPAMIEWDLQIPPLETLMVEVEKLRTCLHHHHHDQAA
ncbi:MAG: DUF692 domain-containing protein [Pseudomonadota bacterium]